jgi:hypothetical protein
MLTIILNKWIVTVDCVLKESVSVLVKMIATAFSVFTFRYDMFLGYAYPCSFYEIPTERHRT